MELVCGWALKCHTFGNGGGLCVWLLHVTGHTALFITAETGWKWQGQTDIRAVMFLQGENTDTDRVAASSSHHR